MNIFGDVRNMSDLLLPPASWLLCFHKDCHSYVLLCHSLVTKKTSPFVSHHSHWQLRGVHCVTSR